MKRKESTDVLVIRIPPEDRVALKAAAIAERKSLSAFIRDAALERALAPAEPEDD